jgi:hypothetical protein
VRNFFFFFFVLFCVYRYQADGFEINSRTAGILVSLTNRTHSDLALVVFGNPSKFLCWPELMSMNRLLGYYAAKGCFDSFCFLRCLFVNFTQGDLEVALVVWRLLADKALLPNQKSFEELSRAHIKAKEVSEKDFAHFWPIAMEGLRSFPKTGIFNLLLKGCNVLF